MDLYEILDVDKDATEDEIRKNYKKKAMVIHPDRNNGEDRGFTDLQKAYEVLSDPGRRKKYDETGSVDEAPKSEAVIRAELARLFGMMIETEQDFKHTDMVEVAKGHVNGVLTQVKDEIKNEQAKLDKLLTAKSRMHRKEGKINMFAGVLAEREAKIGRRLEGLVFGIEINEKILAELDEYEYTFEEVAQQETSLQYFIIRPQQGSGAWGTS